MKERNVVLEKSYAFVLRTIKLYGYLQKEKKEYHLSKQLIRSGTSIGANIEEAIGASSRKDFKAKLDIAHKETRETKFWLRLLKDSDLLEPKIAGALLNDCEELIRLLIAILNTLKQA